MANAVATIKIMPESPEIDLEALKAKILEAIESYAGEGDTKTEIEPIAFGLKALKITFVMDEALGSPDTLSEKVQDFEGVNSAEIVDVRRAVG